MRDMDDGQLMRYSRHILLDEMGVDAQERLLASTALVVGTGGLGAPAALYLAAAGIGRILLADADTVDLTNLQRQVLHREATVGMPKVESGRRALAEINHEVEVVPLRERLAGAALEAAVARSTVVLDCSDNFATRHAVNRACVRAGVPLVSGAAIRFDGQLAVFDARRPDSPCYHCLFPEGQEIEDVRCAVMGVFAPLTGIVGTMQAAEALKLAGGFGTPMVGKLLLIDARSMELQTIALPRDPRCAVCGPKRS
jgi:molybdopterin/thiamine biosynthesis adenylyltransferase